MPKIDFLLLFVIDDSELYISGLLIRQNRQFEDLTLGSCDLYNFKDKLID